MSFITFSAPKIILKLDDIGVKKGTLQCSPALDYLVHKKLKAGLGIIAARNDSTALAILIPYISATNSKGEKLIEIWHHGLDHSKTEFKDSTYEFQKAHFEQADKLIKKLLGIQMHTFGTPYNASDSTTNKVIAENPNYAVFLYSSKKPTRENGILYLDNRVNMENGTGKPEFDYFIENYGKAKAKYNDYMILQGHPNMWTPEKLEQFTKVIDFLISEGCEFVLPYDYYLSVKSHQ
jgi:peptidoglycan/xylan/chitin deacetylase (PgdA/CDA1 family)